MVHFQMIVIAKYKIETEFTSVWRNGIELSFIFIMNWAHWIFIKQHATIVPCFLKTVLKLLAKFHKHLVELFLRKSATAHE